MKKRLLCLALALVMVLGLIPMVNALEVPTHQEVYNTIIGLKDEYPEGMEWTNEEHYNWQGGGYYMGGYGCAAFAFILSDAAFGWLPARMEYEFDYDELQPGDILRMLNSSGGQHFVVILEVHDDYVVITEGNYLETIHWGRKLTREKVENDVTYILTRYPKVPTDDEPRYTITLNCAEHGTAWVNKTSAAAGETIEFGYKAAPGFSPCSVQLLFSDHYDYDVMDAYYLSSQGGVPMFLMPEQDMTINVTFWRPDDPDNPFEDVFLEDFYHDPVLWAYQEGITTGTSPNLFSPLALCNRAQVVTFLWRAHGSPAPTSRNNPFTDVPDGIWYSDAVLWALENGITTGTTATTFSPEKTCNRAQVVTFLWRAHGSEAPTAQNNPFTDVPGGTWYTDAVLWALENGITTGTTATTFSPTGDCMRASVVTFLYRSR